MKNTGDRTSIALFIAALAASCAAPGGETAPAGRKNDTSGAKPNLGCSWIRPSGEEPPTEASSLRTLLEFEVDFAAASVSAHCNANTDHCPLGADEIELPLFVQTYDKQPPVWSENPDENTVAKLIMAGSNGDDTDLTFILVPTDDGDGNLAIESMFIEAEGDPFQFVERGFCVPIALAPVGD